ncbi:MAG TPA: SelB C-terminal domain-containing protein, partial [Vicinamibacterales bacterium]|nr:SelB C-terminal domain-containing protein [Vicinamibacterales bacterium]
VDDELELLPAGIQVKVRGLHVHGRSRTSAAAGERVALNLVGVEVADVARGSVVAALGALRPTRRLDARVTMLPAAGLRHGARVRVHQGTAEVLARVSVAGASGVVPPGGAADVRLRLEAPATVTRGDRFILRSYSPLVTVGGGAVLDPLPPRAGVRTARGVARMTALQLLDDRTADCRTAVLAMTAGAGIHGVTIAELASRTGAARAELLAILDALDGEGKVVVGGDSVVDGAIANAPVAAVMAGLAEFHRASPLVTGMSLELVRGRWFATMPPPVFDRVIGSLVAAGRVVARDTLALTSHRVSMTPEELEVYQWIDRRYLEAGFSPPDAAALAGEARRAPAVVERITQLMLKEKRLQRVDALVFHRDVLDRLKQDVVALKAAAGNARATVDVKSFKDTYNVSRKFAIPLLEYLDRERITKRAGDVRIVL